MKRATHIAPFAILILLLSLAASTVLAAETVTVRRTLALTYPEGPTISLKFEGTYRLPRASGEAKVERKEGTTEVEIELDEMKPASLFGGDFNTYVLWAASPEGHVDNLGEFILDGNRSKLNVSTGLETFGLFVTAEPHFLVSSPSRMVVLENTRPTEDLAQLKESKIEYEGFEGLYRFEKESLTAEDEADDEVRAHIASARTAVELARRAGAPELAPDEYRSAREALRVAESTAGKGSGSRMIAGHEAVRQAVRAQKLAERRAFEQALAAERQENARQIDQLQNSIRQAETAAEKARLQTQQRELELRLEERARQQALEAARAEARRAAAAEARAERLAREKAVADAEAADARAAAADARDEAATTRREWEQTRARLSEALGKVTSIRESARGLIVDIPDVLFDFDKANLKPQAREMLAKMAGIMLVTGDFSMRVEGHTDSIGTEEYNLDLSRDRADAVRSYLVEAGLPADIISVEAQGESEPIADNDTREGRQKNRRVEIHIEEPVTIS